MIFLKAFNMNDYSFLRYCLSKYCVPNCMLVHKFSYDVPPSSASASDGQSSSRSSYSRAGTYTSSTSSSRSRSSSSAGVDGGINSPTHKPHHHQSSDGTSHSIHMMYTGIRHLEVHGIASIFTYWEAFYSNLPDTIYRVTENKLRVFTNRHCSITSSFQMLGTKLFPFCYEYTIPPTIPWDTSMVLIYPETASTSISTPENMDMYKQQAQGLSSFPILSTSSSSSAERNHASEQVEERLSSSNDTIEGKRRRMMRQWVMGNTGAPSVSLMYTHTNSIHVDMLRNILNPYLLTYHHPDFFMKSNIPSSFQQPQYPFTAFSTTHPTSPTPLHYMPLPPPNLPPTTTTTSPLLSTHKKATFPASSNSASTIPPSLSIQLPRSPPPPPHITQHPKIINLSGTFTCYINTDQLIYKLEFHHSLSPPPSSLYTKYQ